MGKQVLPICPSSQFSRSAIPLGKVNFLLANFVLDDPGFYPTWAFVEPQPVCSQLVTAQVHQQESRPPATT